MASERARSWPPNERAKVGLFLAFQYPHSVPGVTMANFLRTAVNSVRREAQCRRASSAQKLREQMALLQDE